MHLEGKAEHHQSARPTGLAALTKGLAERSVEGSGAKDIGVDP